MPTFAYIARDPAGRRVKGRVDGASESAALADLSARGLSPIRIDATRASRRRVGVRALASSYRQLSELLRSGVPLLRALRLLGRGKSNPTLAAAWSGVADALAAGDRLADAMERQQGIFAPVHIAMVRAGERGAFLEAVLARLATLLEQQADLRARVIGNLLYPVVLLLVGLGVVVAALVFFVPKFEDFFSKMPDLPLATELLLATSRVFTAHPVVASALVLGAVLGLIVAARSAAVRSLAARRILRAPFLGPLIASIAVARFARMLGTLLENGIPMLQALEIARSSAGNPVLSDALARSADAVKHGEPLSKPLEESGLFAEDVVEMISVGESANNLPSVLVRLADTLEARIDRALSTLLRLMEPAMLLVIAAVVMFIFLALVVPMMQLSSQL
ncbi:MAG: type II secretion system F family protein [Planctomycetaceae bacterium]|nr:type II secretion system F family protein [Planctomycetaceae bacterium]